MYMRTVGLLRFGGLLSCGGGRWDGSNDEVDEEGPAVCPGVGCCCGVGVGCGIIGWLAEARC